MRDKAYRHYQNKTHNDRHYDHCGNPYFKTRKKNRPGGYMPRNIEWPIRDERQIAKGETDISDNNGTRYHKKHARQISRYYN